MVVERRQIAFGFLLCSCRCFNQKAPSRDIQDSVAFIQELSNSRRGISTNFNLMLLPHNDEHVYLISEPFRNSICFVRSKSNIKLKSGSIRVNLSRIYT